MSKKMSFERAKELSDKGILKVKSLTSGYFDPVREPDPDKLHNNSRDGFLFSPFYHPIGRKFQRFVKQELMIKSIDKLYDAIIDQYAVMDVSKHVGLYKTHTALTNLCDRYIRKERKREFMHKAITVFSLLCVNDDLWKSHTWQKDKKLRAIKHKVNTAHRFLTNSYDIQAFVFDDERLNYIHESNEEIIDNIRDERCIDVDNMFYRANDIFVFLMKEDIYYRVRWLKMIQDFMHEYPECFVNDRIMVNYLGVLSSSMQDMEFTDKELENLEKWD